MASVRIPHHGDPMPGPMNVSWRLAALGLVVGALLAGGALAVSGWATSDPAPAPPGPAAPVEEDHALEEDARCAHMPEHCPPGGAR